MKSRSRMGVAAVAVGIVGALGAWGWYARKAQAVPRMVYSSAGYGGYVPSPKANAKGAASVEAVDPVQAIEAAYQAGQYAEVERLGSQMAQQNGTLPTEKQRRQALKALCLTAYAAAQKKDYAAARDRFAQLQEQASELEDHGAVSAPVGEVQPTLEEEGAYEHAVCLSALGESKQAEMEYRTFLERYPESVLIHAAVKRIGRFHGGDVPKDAEVLWQQAMQTQQTNARKKQYETALCGPECLAELLRRRGEKPDVHVLAKQLHTDGLGTSLYDLVTVAKQKGFTAQGLALTAKGLQTQKLPLIALLKPGHYVLLETVTPSGIQVWDPDRNPTGQGSERTIPLTEWNANWSGTAVTLR